MKTKEWLANQERIHWTLRILFPVRPVGTFADLREIYDFNRELFFRLAVYGAPNEASAWIKDVAKAAAICRWCRADVSESQSGGFWTDTYGDNLYVQMVEQDLYVTIVKASRQEFCKFIEDLHKPQVVPDWFKPSLDELAFRFRNLPPRQPSQIASYGGD